MKKMPKYVPTVSATEYVESVGKRLRNYVLEGVSGDDMKELVASGKEMGAEAIVSVRETKRHIATASIAAMVPYMMGTALIPKNRKSRQELPSTLKKNDILNVM